MKLRFYVANLLASLLVSITCSAGAFVVTRIIVQHGMH